MHKWGTGVAISAWIPGRVVNDQYRKTSVIHTLRERWSLGQPFSAREAIAADIRPVLSLETPREPDDWPARAPAPRSRHSAVLCPARARNCKPS